MNTRQLRIQAKTRILLAAGVKIGKTYHAINKLAVPYSKKGFKVLYITLDSVNVREQEEEEFIKAGFKNIFVAGRDKWTQEAIQNAEVAIFTTNHTYDKALQATINHWHIRHKIICLDDEYDYKATGTWRYHALKNESGKAVLIALKPDDVYVGISATHLQLFTMPITFTHVEKVLPHKPGYSSLLGLEGKKHERVQLNDNDYFQFKHDKLIPNSIINILDKGSPTTKVMVKLTNFVEPRENNLSITQLTDKITKQGNRKVYEARGGKEGTFRSDSEYIESSVVIAGQPTGRAVELPNVKYTIVDVSEYIDKGSQDDRMASYSEFPRTVFTDSIGIKRLEEYDKYYNKLYQNLDDIAKMNLEEREKWALDNLQDFQHIKFFTPAKEGQFKTTKASAKPETILPWSEGLQKGIEETKEVLVDEVIFTKGKEGTYTYGNSERQKEQFTEQYPGSDTKLTSIEKRKNGIICGSPPKQAGNLAVKFSVNWSNDLDKWWQIIFKDEKAYLALFNKESYIVEYKQLQTHEEYIR